MANSTKKESVKVAGFDTSKQSFQFHGVDEGGHIALKKKLTRGK